ncbi:aspartic proteinase-like protein 2-like protein [Chrysochromulina tobinii]|uniref:Aspartic proteinase-like protein 2-like protein n=1 Tax=Chrysochromulina tobinii TaxID=1460289 RepID=A0A0M0JKM3_9EUKA|nr:aspartic proteinase-like protein 2-like protein [Chrysochromulina tobinii]|eukprot:KOO27015.1 aspartic proteinase-like protein 2-like protein [Chrysochromulina sp. CCMP291]
MVDTSYSDMRAADNRGTAVSTLDVMKDGTIRVRGRLPQSVEGGERIEYEMSPDPLQMRYELVGTMQPANEPDNTPTANRRFVKARFAQSDRYLLCHVDGFKVEYSTMSDAEARKLFKHGITRTARRGRRLGSAVISERLSGDLMSRGYFAAEILVGTPPQRFSLIVDTGSSITALPCAECSSCGEHANPRFRPAASRTFEPVGCGERDFGCTSCQGGACAYHVVYQEGSSYSGYLATDVVHLGAGGACAALRIAFGCATVESGHFRFQQADGIMGLASSRHLSSLEAAAEMSDAAATEEESEARRLQQEQEMEAHRQLDRCFAPIRVDLADGGTLSMSPSTYFYAGERTGEWCAGVFDNYEDGMVLGTVNLIDRLVMFDREQGRVGFASTDCDRFDPSSQEEEAADVGQGAAAHAHTHSTSHTEPAIAASAASTASALPSRRILKPTGVPGSTVSSLGCTTGAGRLVAGAALHGGLSDQLDPEHPIGASASLSLMGCSSCLSRPAVEGEPQCLDLSTGLEQPSMEELYGLDEEEEEDAGSVAGSDHCLLSEAERGPHGKGGWEQ